MNNLMNFEVLKLEQVNIKLNPEERMSTTRNDFNNKDDDMKIIEF